MPQTEECVGCSKIVATAYTIETPNGKGICFDCVGAVDRKALTRLKTGQRRRR